jgi:WD40 repeat protein
MQLARAAVSPTGDRIATWLAEGTVKVWSADRPDRVLELQGHTAPGLSAAFSADGKRLVTASIDTTARIWKTDGSGVSIVLDGHTGMLTTAAFSPDGLRVVTASVDRSVLIWDTSTEVLLKRLRDQTTDCLPPQKRQAYLDETADEAQERYEACERSYGRKPFYLPGERR